MDTGIVWAIIYYLKQMHSWKAAYLENYQEIGYNLVNKLGISKQVLTTSSK